MSKEFFSVFWRAFLALSAVFLSLFLLPYLALCFFGEIAAIIILFVVIVGLFSILIAGAVTFE